MCAWIGVCVSLAQSSPEMAVLALNGCGALTHSLTLIPPNTHTHAHTHTHTRTPCIMFRYDPKKDFIMKRIMIKLGLSDLDELKEAEKTQDGDE